MQINAKISAIEYYLPENILTNESLEKIFPVFTAAKIFSKTGIKKRHISAPNETSTDMAIHAAKKLLHNENISPNQIDFLLFCTQTPDYLLPTNACIIQQKLNLKTSVGALDFNLGCSGYIYGLSLAKALIESKQANNVLLLTSDTYSKLLEKTDKSVRTIFGDGASATLISAEIASTPTSDQTAITPSIFGTDGQGAFNLCALGQGMRHFNQKIDPFLRMNGPEIFKFTIKQIPSSVEQILKQNKITLDEIDLFVFHQANAYMLEHLRKKINIPKEKFLISMEFCGNTVSSSIPIALKEAQKKSLLFNKKKVLLIGFGVGYSWAANIVDLTSLI